MNLPVMIEDTVSERPLKRQKLGADEPNLSLPELDNYIPVGCLHVKRDDCYQLSSELWEGCDQWSFFMHPRDLYDTENRVYLNNIVQEKLLSSSTIKPYEGLLHEAWIRMEFRAMNENSGLVRVYVLPDDVCRSSVPRYQSKWRKVLGTLIGNLNISKTAWRGDAWTKDDTVVYVDIRMNGVEEDTTSLFNIFNTLPSPDPEPAVVVDEYVQDAMKNLLNSKITGLKTTLKPFQRRSAALMLQRESQPSLFKDPRLICHTDQKGEIWYCDLADFACLREPRMYESPNGGILAETMGLGKTLICLSLILATKHLSSEIPVEHSVGTLPIRKTTGSLVDMAAATIGRHGMPWVDYFDEIKRRDGSEMTLCIEAIRRNPGHYYLPAPVPRRESRRDTGSLPPRKIFLTAATLVVVPANLVKQWQSEIKKHTTGLKVLVMTVTRPANKKPLPPASELALYDIILFSKQRFEKESKDGGDSSGRRLDQSNLTCQCPYIGASRKRDCTCLKDEDIYHSPLKDLHFKRLITDEGHAFGNASKKSKTEALTVIEFLQLGSRWIISGTPTPGLWGTRIDSSKNSSSVSSPSSTTMTDNSSVQPSSDGSQNGQMVEYAAKLAFDFSERKDLEKLGNIAVNYLKARPWANTIFEGDCASWAEYVCPPRGANSKGSMECLRSTLEGMIIRHRQEDADKDVSLPPLNHDIVYLDGSFQDKLSLNMFSMAIVSNAVTSERKDADYLFHPSQRKALNELVGNLRQASFHWSGFTLANMQNIIEISKEFLDDDKKATSTADKLLLCGVIQTGEIVLANGLKKMSSTWHEIPFFVQNELPEDIRAAWALDGEAKNPTLMSPTMIRGAQEFVQAQLWKANPMEGLVDAGKKALEAANEKSNPPPISKKATKGSDSRSKKADRPSSILAGGVASAAEPAKLVKSRTHKRVLSVEMLSLQDETNYTQEESSINQSVPTPQAVAGAADTQPTTKLKSALKKSSSSKGAVKALDPDSPLATASIISTASAKLSYLLDRIIALHQNEKILVFYEAENTAYYIAQALECLHIKHLIYAKTLDAERKAQYVVTFNQTETFRILLMDLSQAAYGLDMSSASRVFFVNPVFSPQIEAQAVKRAHRIGQTKPVYVETLVLRDSIEEAILTRKQQMTTEEHGKCKTILDDSYMYETILNPRFIPLPSGEVPSPAQMAELGVPQLVFGGGVCGSGVEAGNPDAELVESESPKAKKGKGKGKKKATFAV